ncbi:BRCA1-associated protein isoform X2 [Citrus clementina]|uniref:BRCA1-associated protein isoform X2 n=1 Tax=Citrus clementina TaxID=85681 RepID=UPI000CED3496|nr:BRCA1-associated protein isoform X2 [Citrus x clementina]
MSSSSSTAVVAGDDEPFRQPLPEMISDDASAFDNAATQTFAFSSGNPRIEETRGVMHLFSSSSSDNSNDGVVSSPSPNRNLPVGRKPLVCVLGVPNHMTYADFCQFCASFIQHILEMRIVRKKFAMCFSRLMYSLLVILVPLSTCSLLLQAQLSSLHVQFALVCRYCQQQPEKSICFVCQTSENLWMCVICGFVGCGRYKGGHAIIHWKETEHCYSLELETQRVWDYAGDNYVHRLIQSKTDGKLVELNSHCLHGKDNCGSCDCVDSGTSDALLSSKVEAIVNEYNELLAAQLENQKIYYETLLQEAKEETEKIISEAVKKAIAQKLQKMQAKLDRCVREKKFLDDLNENLLKNQEMWKAKISEIEEREKMALRAKDDKIQDSEAQLRDLMVYLEAEKTLQQLSISNEIKDGTVLPMSVESSTSTGTKGKGKKI